jgi:hypothetical protein
MQMAGFQIGTEYPRDFIRKWLGGNNTQVLIRPGKARNPDRKVVGCCFRSDKNSEATADVFLFGASYLPAARAFATQQEFVPFFVKRGTNRWQFVGNHRVAEYSEDPGVIANHKAKARHDARVEIVLRLERQP